MSSASPYAALFEHLALGGLVVLPNTHAARTLRSAFDRHQSDLAQRGLGPSAWEPARARSWQQFTTGLFNDLVLSGDESHVLLNEAQEHHLWREIIAATQPDALTSTDSLAELARSAWHLASAYNATQRLAATANTEDTRTFAAWATDFTARCKKTDVLSLAQLNSALLTHLQRNSLAAPAQLHLAAFDDPTPSQSALIEALRALGTTIIDHKIGCPTSGFSGMGSQDPRSTIPLRASIIAPTDRDELILAARWIRNFLEQHRSPEQNQSQNKSIAVLVPSLDDDRAQLELIFREVLAPELESIHADLSSTPWQFSTGLPLASLPLIRPVLELSQWAHAPLSLDRISALLLSPFLGIASDRNLAAQFDAAVLRRSTLLRPELDLIAILTLADTKSHIALLPAWLRNFHLQVTRAGNLESLRTFAEWSEFLRGLLHAVQWPGERTLTAAEFEATRAWDSVLDLLSTLDYSGNRVSLATFLESLDRQTRVTNFSGPSTHAPVQVMSIEDAAGSIFDAVLFLRATDANWPRSPQPNPLLSWQLQQQLAMPGASSTATIAHARSFTTRLLARSGATLFFSAAENADGHLRPTSLLTELEIPVIVPNELIPTSQPVTPLSIEEFADTAPLPPLPSTEIHGGASVLRLQAACGFRAFAEFRLQAKELEEFTIGLDAQESGQLIHRALRDFWAVVKTQSRLRSLSPEDREHHLRRSIDAAISRHLQLHNTWDEAFIALQRQRLLTLLDRWLLCELERSPFEVLVHEHEDRIAVGPLSLEVRFDRIDKLDASSESGDSFVLVDYKTGASGHPNQWEGERPDDPQLPLYALAYQPNELKALTFAKVTTEKMKWLGYQAEPGGILPSTRSNQNPPRNLSELIDEWRSVLTQLANDFAAGRAFVAPKDYPKTCEHCRQRLFCRLNPAALTGVADYESAEESDG
jgi:probable DNA repair protein